MRSKVARRRAKAAHDGRLPKKKRCDRQRQFDEPNLAVSMDALRSRLIEKALRRSHGSQSQQNYTSRGSCALSRAFQCILWSISHKTG